MDSASLSPADHPTQPRTAALAPAAESPHSAKPVPDAQPGAAATSPGAGKARPADRADEAETPRDAYGIGAMGGIGGVTGDAGRRTAVTAALGRRVGAADHAASRLVGVKLPHPQRLTRLIGIVSRSGDHGYIWYATAALPLMLRRPRGTARFFYVAGGVFAGEMLNFAVKLAVRRPRPSQAAEDGGNYIKVPATHSFPSAHATMGVIGWATLSRLYPRLRAPLAGLVAFLAFSRAYLRVHYPFDVLAGLGLGALVAAAYTRLVRAPLVIGRRANGGSP